VLAGGAGNDSYYIGAGDTVIELPGEGTDTVSSYVDFTLPANVENLVFNASGTATIGIGNELNNSITGYIGNDTLDGGAGNDTLSGGLGDDTYVVDSVGDVIVENANAGIDTVRSSASWTLGANLENLTLIGSAPIDGTGNALANVITGNDAANVLTGGAGNDTVDGGGGIDTAVFTGTAA
jgi:Ca2+-binding RTX toxin-like protein